MTRSKPTERQRDVLKAIHDYFTANQRPPTIREIGNALGITSTNGVVDHLLLLEKKGFITVYRRITRGIRLTDEGLKAL